VLWKILLVEEAMFVRHIETNRLQNTSVRKIALPVGGFDTSREDHAELLNHRVILKIKT